MFFPGKHTLEITYEGIPVPGSPYKVQAVRGSDHTKCKAYGPGLNGGYTHVTNQFTVETKGAGTGGLALAIEGPSEAKMTCKVRPIQKQNIFILFLGQSGCDGRVVMVVTG